MSDIREALQSAMTTTTEAVEEVAPAEVTEASDAQEGASEVEPVAVAAPEASEAEKPKVERVRGPDGKFVKKEAAESATPVKAPKPAEVKPLPVEAAPVVPEAPKAPKFKAPQSWKPVAREDWAKLPETVQAEVDRRERETAVAMQEAADARKFHQAFQHTVAPYEGMLRASGVEPIKAVDGLLRTVYALQTQPPAHKAAIVANMVKSYGIPIEALDAALAGEAPKSQQAAPVDPNTIAAQVREQLLRDVQAKAAEREAARAQQDVQAFLASGKAEFFEDVKDHMAKLMEAGLAKNLEDAYNAAVKLNPEILSVIQQREKAKQANAAMASTQRARAAASSVKSQPSAVQPPQATDDRRSALRAAMAKASGG